MIMGICLETVQNWLISTYPHFDKQHCGIQHRGFPPDNCRDWYVALDDGGVSSEGGPEDYWLGEAMTIEVAIWRRQRNLPREKVALELVLEAGIYREQAKSLDRLEREVLAIHQNGVVIEQINGCITQNPGLFGACLVMPFVYRGRGPNEDLALPWNDDGSAMPVFLGRRLRFKGGTRWQRIDFSYNPEGFPLTADSTDITADSTEVTADQTW